MYDRMNVAVRICCTCMRAYRCAFKEYVMWIGMKERVTKGSREGDKRARSR